MVEHVPYMSIRDIIMVVCDKDNNDAGRTWRNLPESYKNEVQHLVLNFQFPGRGQSQQPVITLPGALKLIMWLPGNIAKEFRSKASEILTQYLGGSEALVQEIRANALRNEPINEVARASMPVVEHDPLLQQIAVDVQQCAVLAPIVKSLTEEMAIIRADRDHQAHLRHQSDGRYGSEVRQANKYEREKADYWRNMAERMQESLAKRDESMLRREEAAHQKDKLICEMAQMLMNERKRARSPSMLDGVQEHGQQ